MEIAEYARELSNTQGHDYSFSGTPKSPYQNLSGNYEPGHSKIQWLKNRNKCNQFVGDVLTLAGLRMPTFKMPDGSEHYMNAERLPREGKFFSRVKNLFDVKPGDIIVIDNLARSGENGAHVEIVSFMDFFDKSLRLIGARKKGAFERDFSRMLAGLRARDASGAFSYGAKDSIVYFLRPKQINPTN
jgi:hypothetical protein